MHRGGVRSVPKNACHCRLHSSIISDKPMIILLGEPDVAKIERNAPCPCGSGKKYKKCCLPLLHQPDNQQARSGTEAVLAEAYQDDIDLLSNSVIDLLDQGRFDLAERACLELRQHFPDQIDWIERRALLYERRGENKKAAEWYRKSADFAQTHEGFDRESVDWFRRKADKLDLL